jgi:hypothetical protein
MECDGMSEEIVRLREEITMQINALKALKRMAESMVMTFLNLLPMQKKLSNGCISLI